MIRLLNILISVLLVYSFALSLVHIVKPVGIM